MGVVQERRDAAARALHDDGSPGPWAGNLAEKVPAIDKNTPLIKSCRVCSNKYFFFVWELLAVRERIVLKVLDPYELKYLSVYLQDFYIL